MKAKDLKSVVFLAVLIGFPISNVVVFFWTQVSPAARIPDDAPRQGERVESLHSLFRSSASHKPGEVSWTTLQEAAYKQFEPFFDSGSQSWRIQKYGKVYIVGDAFLGAVVSSGMGTASTNLAEVLTGNGFDVTMLYIPGKHVETATADFWGQYYGSRGIRFVPLPPQPVPYDCAEDIALSHRVFMWLSQQPDPSVVHFMDSKGRGYFSMLAKAQGLLFQRTQLILHTHMPHLWYKMNSLQMLDDMQDLILDFMERESCAMADAIVSPSTYMLDWMRENSWQLTGGGGAGGLPSRVFVQPNLMPTWVHRRSRVVMEELTVSEIVFFGRLELKKGLVLFCDSLDKMAAVPDLLEGVTVTFLGRVPSDKGEWLMMRGGARLRVDEFIRDRAKKWKFRWQILKDMDAQARMDYMQEGHRLAVMPSLLENSPFTVMECLMGGLPFLTTRIGGVEEMIAPDDQARVLIDDPRPKVIAERIQHVLEKGIQPAQPVLSTGLDKTWVVWHHAMVAQAEGAAGGQQSHQQLPLVSVCIVTYNNPTLLKQALQSIEEQDYPNFEVVVVDDGSMQPDSVAYLQELSLLFQARGWKLMQKENGGPGAARNKAAELASGEWLMFMDDDNYAKRHELSTFIKVARHTGAEVLTCTSDYFYGQDAPGYDRTPTGRWVPLGPASTVGMFQNMYGDTNAMIKKDVFLKLGGFPEDFGYALEDWELFSKAVLGGYKLHTVPEPLFWYRLREASHSKVTARAGSSARTIRPYLKKVPNDLHHLVLFAQGMKDAHDTKAHDILYGEDALNELRKMLKALASSISNLCQEGRLQSGKNKNLLGNAAFEVPTKGEWPLADWKPYGTGWYTHDTRGGRMSVGEQQASSMKVHNADWRDSSGALQEILLNQHNPAAVVISGWSKADKVSGHTDGGYAIYVDIQFADGTKLWGYTINFEVGTHDWQFKAGVIDPEVPIHSLVIHAMFRFHSGTAWFDDFAVNLLSDGLCEYTHLTLNIAHTKKSVGA